MRPRGRLLRATVLLLVASEALGGKKDSLFENAIGVEQLDRSGVWGVSRNETDAEGWIVVFYAPWCGHCQHYAPEFRRFGEALAGAGREIRAGVVSCTAERKACDDFGVRGYPTVKSFGVLGDNAVVKKRSPKELLGFVAKKYKGWEAPKLGVSAAEFAPKRGRPRYAGKAPPSLGDAAASLRYAMETAVYGGETLERERLVALRGVLAAVARAVPAATLAPALLRCLAGGAPSRDDWAAWLADPTTVACNATRAPVKVDAKAWSATCDPDGAGPETGGVYTCGLWSLFHAIAAAAPDRLATRDAMAAIRAVVAHFFGCETCKDHFLEMYDTCAHGRCDAAADASLWLWRAHNAVNVRVKGGADFEWPSPESCAQCKKDASWDEARVKVFLRRSYREGGASARSFRRRAALP